MTGKDASAAASDRKLVLDDIADLRAYERERETFRSHVIALKRKRRVHLGPFVTMLFENRDTIRFQIQEMARAEKIYTDQGIQTELDIYNPLIPVAGQLCATLFIELTTKEQLMEWLPKLVGIERSIELRFPDGSGGKEAVGFAPDADHAEQLTREETTSAVHYVHIELTPAQVARIATADEGDVVLASIHPAYVETSVLQPAAVAELLSDLEP